MADLEHVEGKHRHRRPRYPRSLSPSDPHGWEQTHHPTLDSLPYRTRPRAADVDIQMPDSASRRAKHSVSSSHRSRRASDDLRESMPLPTTLNRSRTVTQRRGRDPLAYEDDEDSSTCRERRPRPRERRRARSRSRSTLGSERSSSRSDAVMTPPRSARVNHSTPYSRRSSRSASSRRTPSVDSASTVSTQTQSEVKEILRRAPAEIQVISDDERPGHRRHRRRHREKEPILYEEEPVHRSRHIAPAASGSRDASRRLHRHPQSRSSSRRRHHRHRDHREEVVKPSSSKRCVNLPAVMPNVILIWR